MKGNALYVLDETLIPQKIKYIKVRSAKEAVKVIREMKTRAFGQFLVVLHAFLLEIHKRRRASPAVLLHAIGHTAKMLNESRPTFPFAEVTAHVVAWARMAQQNNENIAAVVTRNIHGYLGGIRQRRLQRVMDIAERIKTGDSILTHCNVSGELAMAAALCAKQRKKIHFFATETRPYLQGAKLTVWELQKMGADVTLIADNAVASVMADKMVNKVIVGSDRNCANGDFANKIGTYQIAVLAKEFKIPFYVLTQPSNKVPSGKEIPVEMRDERELLTFGGRRVAPARVRGFYPGFDVVPHELVTKAIAINVDSR